MSEQRGRSTIRPIAIVGPTGSGKSAASVAVAKSSDGEIVNIDSMQLYAGMDIGTAKLTEAEREGIPHHLLDIWDVTQPASVAEYLSLIHISEPTRLYPKSRMPSCA